MCVRACVHVSESVCVHACVRARACVCVHTCVRMCVRGGGGGGRGIHQSKSLIYYASGSHTSLYKYV